MTVNFDIADIVLIMPALALFIASLVPLTIKVLGGNREQNPLITLIYAFIGLISAAGLTITTYGAEKIAFNGALIFDGISSWTNLIIVLITGFALMFSRESRATCTKQFSEYVFLLLNSAMGMMIVAWSNDLIVTFIGIEIMSLCLYMLIALSQEEILSKEAALKYFILGSFGSAIFLYGIAFLFGPAGTTHLNQLVGLGSELITTSRIFMIGMALVLIGLAFKIGLVPFHAWSPDVYEGSPTPVVSFMATGVKVVIFAALLRLMHTQVLTADRAWDLVVVLQWIAVASMLLGNIAAIMQVSLKRMLAYSSIAHSGYALVGIIAAGLGGESILGAAGTMFYIFAYTIMTLGTFGFVCLFEKNNNTVVEISDLRGLAKRDPWMSFVFTLLLLSLAGIPPLVGFFGKFFIFSAAIKQGLFWLAVWGVINSVISVYYYLKPVVYMYMSEDEALNVVESKQLTHFAVGLMALLVVFVGIAAQPFYHLVLKMF